MFSRKGILRTRIWAHVIERIGLAMMGASCGLFVAAEIVSGLVATFGTLGFIFAMTAYGGFGGYLGVDVPRHAAHRRRQAKAASHRPAAEPDPVEYLSALGTFLAALMAMLSVYIVILNEDPGPRWSMAIGFAWLIGVTMQIAAGMIARMRKTDPVVG
jgi:hypothetical protein